ncbi:MAG: tetratricopeptide repeat-containing sulfotransferase family protein [Rhodanobacteraceae bacterium]
MPSPNDRLFAPPRTDADKVEARLAQLPARLRRQIERAGNALAAGDAGAAQQALSAALAVAPGQPDVLRLHGLLLAQSGNHQDALAGFEAALRAAPDDAVTFWQYARTCEDAGRVADAFALRQCAVERLPLSALAWEDLGEHLFTYAEAESAIAPLERAAGLAPDFAPGLLKLGNAYVACGRSADAARRVRQAIAVDPAFGAAWLALSDIKTVPVTTDEMHRMRRLLENDSPLASAERTVVGFALALACEQTGAYAEAWRRAVEANALRRQELSPWDAEHFQVQERQADAAFCGMCESATDPELGHELIFIVGMPRSGTTLVEQVLAAHAEVNGAGELAALPQALTEESSRRQHRYPEWIPDATAADWQRLGERYLELTRGFRQRCPRSTDKLPGNWRALGAIRAMLPGAHVIACRRDPLENCWSCFRQYFPNGLGFTNDIRHLGLFWRGFDHAAAQWAARAPARVREQHYEALSERPDAETHALLDFCGLPFDASCLRPHTLQRSVRTLSAAQVREPVRAHRPVAAAYGALLDPLRIAVGLAPLGSDARPGHVSR